MRVRQQHSGDPATGLSDPADQVDVVAVGRAGIDHPGGRAADDVGVGPGQRPKAPWGTGTEFVTEAIRHDLFGDLTQHVQPAQHAPAVLSYAATDETLHRGIEILRELARAEVRRKSRDFGQFRLFGRVIPSSSRRGGPSTVAPLRLGGRRAVPAQLPPAQPKPVALDGVNARLNPVQLRRPRSPAPRPGRFRSACSPGPAPPSRSGRSPRHRPG